MVRLCPDCPTHGDPKDPKFLEAAKLTLAKFNAESNHTHYYAVLQVTKATSQVRLRFGYMELIIFEENLRYSACVLYRTEILRQDSSQLGLMEHPCSKAVYLCSQVLQRNNRRQLLHFWPTSQMPVFRHS